MPPFFDGGKKLFHKAGKTGRRITRFLLKRREKMIARKSRLSVFLADYVQEVDVLGWLFGPEKKVFDLTNCCWRGGCGGARRGRWQRSGSAKLCDKKFSFRSFSGRRRRSRDNQLWSENLGGNKTKQNFSVHSLHRSTIKNKEKNRFIFLHRKLKSIFRHEAKQVFLIFPKSAD
jgi:hypothetical protein